MNHVDHITVMMSRLYMQRGALSSRQGGVDVMPRVVKPTAENTGGFEV